MGTWRRWLANHAAFDAPGVPSRALLERMLSTLDFVAASASFKNVVARGALQFVVVRRGGHLDLLRKVGETGIVSLSPHSQAAYHPPQNG